MDVRTVKARRAFKAWKHEFDEDRRKIQAGRVKAEIMLSKSVPEPTPELVIVDDDILNL